jgi:hypothetical protein
MYLPTDLATILRVMATKARETLNFWSGPIMADADPTVRAQAIEMYKGQESTLLNLVFSL